MRAVILLVLLAPAALAEEAEFVQRLDWVEREARAGRWKLVRTKLPEILEEHRGQGYVLSRRDAITDLMRRCLFRLEHATPEPADVVSHLVWAGSSRDVTDVWVGGEWVVEAGACRTVDLGAARDAVRAVARRIAG